MAYELQQETFKAAAWKRLAETESALQKSKELTRYVSKVIDDQRATDLLFLYTYVDASNYPTARSSVASPQADRNVYAGTWRLVSNGVDPQLPGYVQKLRLGFATAIAWDEAFLVDGDMATATRRTIVVEFRNFDPAYVETASAALLATSPLTNPTIQTKEYTGTWIISKIKPRQDEDGSYSIIATLTYVNTITAIADLLALTPIKTGLKDVDHPFGDAGGFTAHNSISNTLGLIYTYKNLTGFAVINAITDANFQSLSEDTAMEFVNKKLTEEDDKSLTLQVAFRRVGRRTWSGASGPAPDLIQYHTEMATVYEKRERIWLGYRNEDEDTILSMLKSGGTADNVTNFGVVDVTYTDNDDGSKNYTQHLQYARTWPVSGLPTPDLKEPVTVSNGETGIRYTFLSYKSEAAHAAVLRAYNAIDGEGDTGKIINGSINSRGNGIFDASYVDVTETDLEGSEFVTTPDSPTPGDHDSETETHTNNDELEQQNANEGEIIRQSSQPKQNGKFRTSLSVDTGKAQQASGSYITKEGTVYWWWGHNVKKTDYDNLVASITFTDATNNRQHWQWNDYGLVDYTITKSPYDGSTFLWAESIDIQRDEYWIEHGHIYDTYRDRNVYAWRKMTQHYHLCVKHNWRDAHAYASNSSYHNRHPTVENHGRGWVGWQPQNDPQVVTNWTSDEANTFTPP